MSDFLLNIISKVIISKPFIDRKYRLARIWSNGELRKFSHLFSGDIVNVSGWKDIDKEGGFYKDYFKNVRSYTMTNYKEESRGLQGFKDEIFLDLECPLSNNLVGKFDVVFNHTVLEHIYNVQEAFKNLCLLTRDIVILVVPFLQHMHADYGDYWRFSPLAIKRMFDDNGMSLLYMNFNKHRNASVYIFAVASKNPSLWRDIIQYSFPFLSKNQLFDGRELPIGLHAISNTGFHIGHVIRGFLGLFLNKDEKQYLINLFS